MLLATDLDGTFLAGDTHHRQQLYHYLAQSKSTQLVFVTGRGLESVMPLLADPTIPQPDYIICDVGATVVHGETLESVQPLQSDIDQIWPGEDAIVNALASYPEITRQNVPHKRRCSFFCESHAVTEEITLIAEKMECDLLYSADRYLDFLPRGVNKGSSLSKLMDHLGVSEDEVLVAGDTLNDLAMYGRGFRGVCVGESEPALLAATREMDKVLHADAPGCGGILQALKHYGFVRANTLQKVVDNQISPGTSDLVIVYHRQPFEEYLEDGQVKHRRPQSPNGIIPTLLSFFAGGQSGAWVAWSTMADQVNDFTSRVEVDPDNYPNLVASKVALSKREVDIFYKRFSKEAFWPTLHNFWERANFREDHWQVFLEVNQKFAEHAAREAAKGAVVWIHDYNLWMVPAFLREIRPDVTIAFFHHTYFPSADVFNVLPWRHEIVGSLLQCDFVGFHIPRQSENFVDVVRGVTPMKVIKRASCAPRFLTYGCAVGLEEMTTEIQVNDRRVRLGACPVGLDLQRVERAFDLPAVLEKRDYLVKEFDQVQMILSVERLDYTKGIVPKLEAFEKLLDQNPELIGNVSLVTICVPAAKEMKVYRKMQTQIEQIVGRINGRFGKIGWAPVQFFFRSFPFEELVAFYAAADVMWVTPLRDGLNLVAKEFVAAQGLSEGDGVLVLSEFTGAAAELRGNLLTNPHDPEDMIQTLLRALNMTQEEAENRLKEAFDVVKRNDIQQWSEDFMHAVAAQDVVPEPELKRVI